jgi:hypothetical protein
MPMRKNMWEFVRCKDGRYAILQNGKLRSDGISEEWREDEFCIRFGFSATSMQRSRANFGNPANVRLRFDSL